MTTRKNTLLLFIIIINLFLNASLLYGKDKKGSYYTGKYQNLFKDLLGKSDDETKAKIDKAFNQLFYGNDSTQRLYFSVGNDMAYLKDINNNDIRTEGMSYGMMIAVQMDKKKEFDCLWKWANTYMQHKSEKRKYYFAWHCRDDGSVIDSNSASDGEEWFVTSLFFASARWGNGEGIFNYKAEALNILNAMLSKINSSDDPRAVTNIFSKKEKMVVFVPSGEADDFTDPSYHLPHFYELWSRWANKDNKFWSNAAKVSRKFLKKTVNPITGLAPDYAKFDGSPFGIWGGTQYNFQFDAWRVAMNIAVDYEWFAKEKWEITQSDKLLNFFYKQGIGKYGNVFTLDGKQISMDHSKGLVAMNAVAALAASNKIKKDFVEELWNTDIPDGLYRYYDGVLYILGLLQVSGNFKIFHISKP